MSRQPQTPSRRSQRFQPTATPSSKSADKNILECSWASEPVHRRKTIPHIDLLPEEQEQEQGEQKDNGGDEEGEKRGEGLQTIFYDAFRMKRKATAYRGSKRMQRGKTETLTYRVGDTVMVETDTLYIMKRPPSIGVIVALWETKAEDADEDEFVDLTKMRIRIHWFLRPSELASIRAKRDHEEVCNSAPLLYGTHLVW